MVTINLTPSTAPLEVPARSKYLPPSLFNTDRRNLTRYQLRRIRAVFDFLNLPAELRCIIYDLCFDFAGIERYFDHAHRMLSRAKNTYRAEEHKPRVVRAKTPPIFLVCRQIYAEVRESLQRRQVNFHHGLLRLDHVGDVMKEGLLNHLGSINITITGHTILKDNILRPSWEGYMILLHDLARILSGGHKLKTLTIDFSKGDSLDYHMQRCWYDPAIYCAFRNHMIDACNDLMHVRGIPQVNIKGLDSELTSMVVARMQTKPRVTFLQLPAEIRNMIYDLAADHNDINAHISRTLKIWQADGCDGGFVYPQKSTPTVLLLNRQIYNEARPRLSKKGLTLNLPDFHGLKTEDDLPDLICFISGPTLRRLHHIDIRVKRWEWVFALERVFHKMTMRHRLKSFHLNFNDRLKTSFTDGSEKVYPDSSLATCLTELQDFRGIGKVTFTGDLPTVYTRPLAKTMRAPKCARDLPVPMAIRGDGEVVEVELLDGSVVVQE